MAQDRGWQAVSEACERRHRSAMTMLSERDWLEGAPAATAPPSRHSRLAGLTQKLRETLREMTRDVEEAARMATHPSVTAGERDRRLKQVTEFRNKERQLVELFARQRTPGTSERDLLLGSSTADPDLEANNYSGSAIDDVINQSGSLLSQEQALREQDEGLDSLHGIISRQRRLAEAIGGEAEAQVELLGGMGDDMERTGRDIVETTRGVAAVERRTGGNGKYWAVIVALFVIIVIVAALPEKRRT